MVELLDIMGTEWVKRQEIRTGTWFSLLLEQIFIEHLTCPPPQFPRSVSTASQLPTIDDTPLTQFPCRGKCTELSFSVIIFIYF